MGGKNDNLWRLIRLVYLLQTGRGYRAVELAEILEVAERTIYRDLHALSVAGVPWYNDGGAYRIHTKFFLKPIQFEFDEIMVLNMATRALSGDERGPYRSAAERARQKIEGALPQDIKQTLAAAEVALDFDPQPLVDLSGHRQTFETLQDAVLRCRRVEVTYYSIGSDEECLRRLDPYGLFFRWRAWYLAAYCHLREEMRLFRVDRIRAIRMVPEVFQRPEGFSLDDYLESALRVELGEPRDVAIWFSARWKRWICEVQWHPSQKIEELSDGSVVLRLRTGSMGEVKRWVLGFGSGVRVLEPGSLVRELGDEIREMADEYASERQLAEGP